MRRMVFLAPLLIIAMLTAAMPVSASAPPFGNDTFRRVWERQDRPVAEQISGRSWMWGPAPNTPALREPLLEGYEGMRVVQYFDKSRMEINDPTANPFSPWYVTNGLPPIELMTGRMQVGYNLFEWRLPARISAVGDPDQFPTYADLLRFYQKPGAVNPNDLYCPATGFINPDGSITGFNNYVNDPATILLPGGNNHSVARAFLDFRISLVWCMRMGVM